MEGPPTSLTPTAGWTDAEQVGWYLERVERLRPRLAGEEVLREVVAPCSGRVLDLGCGDGRVAALVLDSCAAVTDVVAIDRSPPMLHRARAHFDNDPRVIVREWDLVDPIVPFGTFGVVVSGFALHHLEHTRKQGLFREVASQLQPGGLFANLDVVASLTPELHAEFLTAIGRTTDDPEDRLARVELQLQWMGEAGLQQVECLWRWRGFALLVGRRPAASDDKGGGGRPSVAQ